MFMLVVHVVALYLIAAAIGVVAWVLWTKQVSVTVMPAPPAEINVHPAPAHVTVQHGGGMSHSTNEPVETLVELLKNGRHLGWRHSEHPDIEEAMLTPGLSVRYPDGEVVEGPSK